MSESDAPSLPPVEASVEPEVRKALWLNHGCSLATLYGDDGEMQCNACHVDFKRDPLARICMLLFALGRLHAGKLPDPLPASDWQPRCSRLEDAAFHFNLTPPPSLPWRPN